MNPRDAIPPMGALSLIAGLPALACLVAWGFGAPPAALVAAAVLGACAGSWALWRFVHRPHERMLEHWGTLARTIASEASSTASNQKINHPHAPPSRIDAPALEHALLDARSRASEHADEARAAAHTLTLALDASGACVIITNSAGIVTHVNANAAAFLDRAPAELLSKRIDVVLTHADLLRCVRTAQQGDVATAQCRLPRPEGVTVMDVRAVPTRTPATTAGTTSTPTPGVILSMRDVTSLALATQQRTDFVANASHELRTPLSSIKGATESLADGLWEDANARPRLTRVITNNVQRLEELIRDLADLSRAERPDAQVDLQTVDLAHLCASLDDQFHAPLRARSLTLHTSVDQSVATITSDPRLLRLILSNLVENACKFAYPSTTITVECARTDHAPTLRIRVSDKGIGIPLDQQARIFERFYQVSTSRTASPTQHPGSGLGLAIVKHAARQLGGTIHVESIWKEGTTMTAELPLHES